MRRHGEPAKTSRLAAAITNRQTNKQKSLLLLLLSPDPLPAGTACKACHLTSPRLSCRPLPAVCLQSHWLSAFQFTRNANRLSFYVCLNIWHVRVAKPASAPAPDPLPSPSHTHQIPADTPTQTTEAKPATVTNPPRQ